jgi:hypothetical protein
MSKQVLKQVSPHTSVWVDEEDETMSKEEIKQDVAIKSRLQYITDEEQLKVIDFIIDYSFKDSKEVYTNGTVLVPLFRVLDAIEQKGNGYQTGGNNE